MKNFDPSTTVEGYTHGPKEKGYWPGTTGSSTSINEIGGDELVNSEMGKSVTDSMINNPTESISMDAPFLQTGLNVKENAESIVSGTGDFCEKSIMSNISLDRYICNKDVNIEDIYTRTTNITGVWKNTTVLKYITVTAFSYSQSGKNIQFSYVAPTTTTGTITSATLSHSSQNMILLGTINFMNMSGSFGGSTSYSLSLKASGMSLTSGQVVSGTLTYITNGLASQYATWFKNGSVKLTLVLNINVTERVWDPKVEWSESCPFNKSGGEGTLSKSECTEADGNKTVYAEGKVYTVYSSCWAYKDTYITQTGTEGSCGEYIRNPVCTVVSRQCDAYSEDTEHCVNEAVTYECENVTQAALDTGTLYPSPENVRRYRLYQDFWTNRAEAFTQGWKKTHLLYPELDTICSTAIITGRWGRTDHRPGAGTCRHPGTGRSVWGLFFRGNEPMDKLMGTVMKSFSETHQIAVMPVTMDGAVHPAFPPSRQNQGQAERMNIQYFLALYLFDIKTENYHPLSYGFKSQDDLARSFYNVATDFKTNF